MIRKERMASVLLAFAFWVALVLVLEPGNIARAVAAGRQLSVGLEVLRMLAAGLIGAAAMPALLLLLRQYPVSGTVRRLRNASWLLLGIVALSGAMNVFSSFLVAWVAEGEWAPSASAVRRQLIGNWALLSFALAALGAIVRAGRAKSGGNPGHGLHAVEPPAVLRDVLVKQGRRHLRINMADVDWIEAEGNYVALHVGERTYLHRMGLNAIAGVLDKARFVRIHRGSVVAIDRVQEVRSAGDGEAVVRLVTGAELRVSKTHRRSLRERWKQWVGPAKQDDSRNREDQRE